MFMILSVYNMSQFIVILEGHIS